MAEQKQSNKERLREITEGIEQGIKELFESEKYRQYLSVMSRFHRYSVNNTMLIYMQRPDATLVAGYNKWRDQFERHVKRGEHGITIIAPTPYRKKVEEQKLDPDTKAPMLDADGKVIMEEKTIEIPMFKPVKVFDVSQTDGKPLPQLASDLTGNVQQFDAFMEALRRTSPVPISILPIEPDTDGFFNLDSQSITIRAGMSEVQTVSAVVHEITHALLHNNKEEPASVEGDAAQPAKKKDRHTEEVEAESVSYAVCQYFGIQTGDNSFGYIATWSQGKELKELRDSLETINKTANQLITSIDRHFKEICKERGIDLAAVSEPEKDTVGTLAKDIEAFMLDVDTFAYLAEIGDDRETSLREITESLASGDVQGIRNWLREVVANEDENTAPAQALLDRVDAMYPPAPQPEITATSAPEQVDYRLVSNFRRASPDDTTYIQAYTYVGSEAPVPGEVLYVGTYDKCLELQEALKAGTITPEAVKAMNEDEKLYLVSDFRYLHIQRTDSGFDYSIYDKYTLALLDGGQLDKPDMHISIACVEICEAFGLDSYAVTYAPLDMVETLQTAQQKPTQRDLRDKLADHFSQEDAAAWESIPELALDQYPMPDPQLTVADLEAYSYLDGDMLPLSRDRAMELHEKDFTVYAISETGDAEMIFDAEDFTTHADSVIFAIERDEWEHSPDFHQQIVDRLEHQEQREQAFLQHSADCFAIYQQKDDSPGRFRPFDEQKGGIQRSGYDLVYTGELSGDVTINAHLGSLWYKFNQEHPVDYHRPSLSVSDIVALKVGGVVSCHYVDSIGYKDVPDFIQPENYLRNAEMTIEDDYNMIDGIINNGTRQTEPAPEQKKKSVMEQLREKPKQPRKKTAHKRSAEQEL